MAELEYVTMSKVSYDAIAKRHKVAKSTVVRRATKHDWKEKRVAFQNERFTRARKLRMESVADIDERHLKKLQLVQEVMNHEFMRLSHKLVTKGELTPRENRIVFDFIGPYTKAIMTERAILGLRTKPVRITNPEDIEAYLVAVGLKEPPADQAYRNAKEAVENLDRLIEHRQRMQSYIDEVDQRGSY